MRKIIYKGKYLTMSTEKIGKHLYERVTMRAGVAVLPIKDNKILFIREYRLHEKKSSLKLLSGWIDKKGMSPLQIAQEELREEISMKADKWRLFYKYDTKNYTVEETKTYFIAEDLQQLPPQENPDSDIVEEIVFLDEKELKEQLLNKEILWDKDIVVALMFFEELTNKKLANK